MTMTRYELADKIGWWAYHKEESDHLLLWFWPCLIAELVAMVLEIGRKS